MEELDAIRERIKKHRLSFVWLIFQLGQRGIATDKTEVSSIFAGTRKGAKADSIIQATIGWYSRSNPYLRGGSYGKPLYQEQGRCIVLPSPDDTSPFRRETVRVLQQEHGFG